MLNVLKVPSYLYCNVPYVLYYAVLYFTVILFCTSAAAVQHCTVTVMLQVLMVPTYQWCRAPPPGCPAAPAGWPPGSNPPSYSGSKRRTENRYSGNNIPFLFHICKILYTHYNTTYHRFLVAITNQEIL